MSDPLPQPPDLPKAIPDGWDAELYKLWYGVLLDDWKSRERDPVEEAKRVRTLEDEREDASLELGRQREDKALEVERQREDKTLEVKRQREDTALAVNVARQDFDLATEVALVKAIHDSYLEVTKASLERSLKRAEFLTATIAAISGTYTTLLGLVYGIGDGQTPLPGRGMIPVAFLGAALVFAAFYVAFLRRSVTRRNLLPSGIGGRLSEYRLKTFMDWMFSGVLARAWALRASVVSFGVGVALLPLPFVDITNTTTTLMTVGGAAVLLLWIGGELWWANAAAGPYVPGPPSTRPSSEKDGPSPPKPGAGGSHST